MKPDHLDEAPIRECNSLTVELSGKYSPSPIQLYTTL